MTNNVEESVSRLSVKENIQIAEKDGEQLVTPWEVEGAKVDGRVLAIDYEKLTQKFGTKQIDQEILKRFETITGKKPHLYLRRGIFFSHR